MLLDISHAFLVDSSFQLGVEKETASPERFQDHTMIQEPRLATRRQLLDHLHAHDFPIGRSTIDKLCAPAVNQGPPVAAWWGRRPLYDIDVAIGWARGRLTAQCPPPRGSATTTTERGGGR